jgi:NADPH:quinone reductase
MRALVIDRPGAFEDLHLAELPTPEPGPGALRVRVEAVGLNPVDYKLLLGSGHPAWTYPFVLGLDVAGVVDAVGPDVDGWEPGERVFYHGDLSKPGGLAEYATIDARAVARIPDGVTAIAAAALPCAGLTAYQAVHRKLCVRAGDTVLIHAGAGGVGGFGVQLAAHAGATVITTCSARNADYVQQLGAHFVIDYTSEDVSARVLEITGGRGVDAAVDMLGTDSATEALLLLAFGGRLACVEALPDFQQWHMFDNGVSVHELALGGAHASGDARAIRELGRMGTELAALVAAGAVDPMVGEVVALDDVPDALRRLTTRHVRGKIVAQV